MEIPTEEIIQKIQASINFDTKLTEGNRNEAIRTIKDQAREILDLQTTICRLKVEIQQQYDDYRISSDLREAGIRLENRNETSN